MQQDQNCLPLYNVYTGNIKGLTLITTRVIIIITCMAASHLKAEQEISQRLLSLSRFMVALQQEPFLLLNTSWQ